MKMNLVVAATGVLLGVNGICTSSWAEQKFTFTGDPTAVGQYVEEHSIDVGDRPGHQVRIYELRYDYSSKEFAFAGVKVKEARVMGMSDYTRWSGAYSTYQTYTLENGDKIFGRSTGTTTGTINSDGTRGPFKFSFVENLVGGTGKFRSIHGQITGGGERAAGAKTLTQHTSGEFWLDE